MDAFPARYHSLCDPCAEQIHPGEYIRLHPDAGAVHEECFEDVGKPPESNGADLDSFNHGRVPGIVVLPRGKTAKDRCDKCFIVHTVGQVGCE